MAKKESDEGNRYKDIGFMCGLEIHQRLATQHKLFCDCPATIASEADPVIGMISRYQRAVAGELGDIDRSAEFEELRNRKFTYRVHRQHTCLVDVDEEPPHGMNEEALELVLSLAHSMGMKPVDELQPMRKEVVDGSDPSAFQRTTLVAVDGAIKVSGYKISIPTIFIEEESSGIVTATEDGTVYDTDRIGIPLVEIDTDPYIPDPKTAKEIALYIGTALRVSGKVQRGIGSIRQDVNVSIREGARVEIKGLQELDKLDRFVENEVRRQQRLVELRDELKKAKASVSEVHDVTDMMKGSNVRIVTNHLEKGGSALAFRLKGFKGFLGAEINPDRRLGTEISDYAKMAKVHGLIHSDENLQGYGFTEEEIALLGKKLALGDRDAFILIAGRREDVERAATLAVERAKYALVGIPLETRAAANTETCTTKFMRPLPGGSRMYPETDAKPILITKEMMSRAMKAAPDVEKEMAALESQLQNRELAERLLLSPKLPLYKSIVAGTKADPKFVANVLIQKFTELRRAGFAVESIDEQRILDMFSAYGSGRITKQAIDEILKEMSLRQESVDNIITVKRLNRIKGKELATLVDETAKQTGSVDQNQLRGAIMAKYRLTVDGAELNSLLNARG